VSGNGQQELLKAISGEEPSHDRRSVQVCGVQAGRMGAGRRRGLGMCFVPEERLGRGAVPRLTLTENAILTAHRKGMLAKGMIRFRTARKFAEDCIARFDVRCGGADAEAKSLSGGNLQKFIVGREILQGPRVMIAAQPTWGVDVGASAQIRQALIDLRDEGVAVLVVSEELDELFEICDRLCVIARGRLSPPKPARETNAETVGLLMAGSFIGAQGVERARASPAGIVDAN
jgi:simple sugar transport system ATP-binding protein